MTQSPALILQSLFDPTKVSAAKLLYHLEVLSSRLMPVQQRDSNEMTQLFRRNFLEAGGLQFVVNVFKRTSLHQDVDIEVRQACYAIAISLARLESINTIWREKLEVIIFGGIDRNLKVDGLKFIGTQLFDVILNKQKYI